MELGTTLRRVREEHGIDREELAAHAGVSVEAVAAAERGEAGEAALGAFFRSVALLAFERSDPADLDDPSLIARQRAMTIDERLEAGFALCEFASDFAGATRR